MQAISTILWLSLNESPVVSISKNISLHSNNLHILAAAIKVSGDKIILSFFMIQLEIFLVILLKEKKLFGNIIFTRKCIKIRPKKSIFLFQKTT